MKNSPIDINIPYTPNMNQIGATYGDDLPGKSAKHYVMWSGGTDSTLLLYELLKHYGPEHVIAISYVYPWLMENKIQEERRHRTAFAATASLRGLGGFKHMELVISQNNIFGEVYHAYQGNALPQALAWLFSVPLYAEQHGYIYDGAIRDDDLTLRLESYHQMFKGLCGVMGDRDLTLREPYLHLTKTQILEKLIDYGLYEETWFCETPGREISKPCLGCTPCKTHMAALENLIYTTTNERIKVLAEYYLKQMRASNGDKKVSLIDAKSDNRIDHA